MAKKKENIEKPNRFIVTMELRSYLHESDIKLCVQKKFQPDTLMVAKIN